VLRSLDLGVKRYQSQHSPPPNPDTLRIDKWRADLLGVGMVRHVVLLYCVPAWVGYSKYGECYGALVFKLESKARWMCEHLPRAPGGCKSEKGDFQGHYHGKGRNLA